MKLSEVLALQKGKKKSSGSAGKLRPSAQPVAGGNSAVKVVRTRETPNPSALQFVLNSQILEHGNLSYETVADCGDDKLCQAHNNCLKGGNCDKNKNCCQKIW